MGRKQNRARAASPPPAVEPEPAVPADGELASQARPPVEVLYCAVCTFPIEYCEFGSSLTRCKDWLKETQPELFDKLYSEGRDHFKALQAKVGTLSLEQQAKIEQDTAKKEAKAEAKADAALKKKLASQVIIRRIERTKRKHVTSIQGLEAFNIDLKKAAKQLASKFATGASVTKTPTGGEEIVVQGDVAEEVRELLEEGVGVLKGVPADNIDIIEEKKKKGGE
ncbi:Translation machinery-associated protein 22 [Leucoagaricus sp. SymC.cos]|nr:Translation machinery-associated protein 22 [Leucoagaricus sp. SymC.cos]